MSHSPQQPTLTRYRRAAGDKGFSLVELAVVIVVIGILVAIAIPVFNGIQAGAKKSAAEAAAANGATMVASQLSVGTPISAIKTDPSLLKLADSVELNDGASDLTNFCVSVVVDNEPASKGPGCSEDPGGDGGEPVSTLSATITVTPSGAGSGSVQITFSEEVTGFGAEDLSVTGYGAAVPGAVSGLFPISATTWVATLTGHVGEGEIVLDLPQVLDSKGNPGSGKVTSGRFTF